MIVYPASISTIQNQQPVRRSLPGLRSSSEVGGEVGSSIVNPPFASNHRTLLPTEGERERRVIERKQNGGDNLAPEP
jgi:hypothetical protein